VKSAEEIMEILAAYDQRHGIQPPACPQPADRSDAGQDQREVAAEPADGDAAQVSGGARGARDLRRCV
jgi:hypothetical protein